MPSPSKPPAPVEPKAPKPQPVLVKKPAITGESYAYNWRSRTNLKRGVK